MQVLKEDLKKEIISKATEEFLEYGYRNSSLRRIAAQCDITVGNLYRYFQNKDELFGTVVTPAIDLLKYFTDHEMIELDDIPINMLPSIIEEVTEEIVASFMNHQNALYIILNRSEGSPFASARKDIIDHMCEHIEEHLKEEKIDYSRKEVMYLPRAYVTAMIEGIISILNQKDEAETLKENAKKFMILSIHQFFDLIKTMR